jgi:hypothetical protein
MKISNLFRALIIVVLIGAVLPWFELENYKDFSLYQYYEPAPSLDVQPITSVRFGGGNQNANFRERDKNVEIIPAITDESLHITTLADTIKKYQIDLGGRDELLQGFDPARGTIMVSYCVHMGKNVTLAPTVG